MVKLKFLVIFFLLAGCTNNIKYNVKPGNEAFMLGNNSEIGVLMAHGFEASPHELLGLAQFLASNNITVYVIRLNGHGTDIRELDNSKWQEWYKDYEIAYNELSNKTRKVYVAGHSLGGALALYLAEQKETAGVISLATPTGLQDRMAEYAWLMKYFKKYEARNISEDEKNYYYDNYSVAGVAQLVEVIHAYKEDLSKITEPILVMQLGNETLIDPNSATYIYNNVKSKNKDIVIISGKGHGLLNGKYKDKVYEDVYDFVTSVK